MPRLLLASTSRYRQQLLGRLRLPFVAVAPDVDETPQTGESPVGLAVRLGRAKAQAVAASEGDAWVLGSDQVAELEGAPLGKPGTRERARSQLASMSGREVLFHTAICLAGDGGRQLQAIDTTRVQFRHLDAAEIARYVDLEQPLDCAGSFKSEGLGIALFDAVHGSDPTALVGLPLIATARLLREAGFTLP